MELPLVAWIRLPSLFTMMDINFKILQSKYFNDIKIFDIKIFVIKIFAVKNFKINIHQNGSRAFNILHYLFTMAHTVRIKDTNH